MVSPFASAADCDLYPDTSSSNASDPAFSLIRWSPPTKDIKGHSLIAEFALTRYDIYLLDDPSAPEMIAHASPDAEICVLQLADGIHDIAMRAIRIDDAGQEDASALSNVVTRWVN
ncbi:MAG: hypothetical protein O7E57_03480 [Gammaproteobacteria bacterium]|nr:hypothetical protein [Gammaproteobacteria bacterium]